MPARVHAFVVVRPDGRTPAALHLKRTLAALDAQTRRVDALTIVLCGDDRAAIEVARASGAEGVITASASTGYAAATRLATSRLSGDAVWLLAQDTAPEPQALARLASTLESPSVAIVAPKLVEWDDRTQIVSLGVTMTRVGAAVGLADGELDQGQHDTVEDALAADVRGLLVRADVWRTLGGLDPALAGADEGLDLGVRARLAGHRVELEPTAVVATASDGVAGLPAPHGRGRARRRTYAERVAALHRRLAYAPVPAVFGHWLSLLPLALWRTIVHLLAKEPAKVLPEWGAAFVALVRMPAVARSRGRIRRTRVAPWSLLAPLRMSRRAWRERLENDPEAVREDEWIRSDLRFFSGGGAWIVIGMAIVSVAAFPALLAWPVLGGGALAPMRDTVVQLWSDALYGLRATGLAVVGPADPFSAVVALLGTLWPADPSRAVVLLWLAALPLAALGGWFAATRVTERSLLRNLAAVAYALSPALLAALVDGRPTGVLVHLLLPWLFYAGSVAHRSWAAAGTASLVFAAVAACAPVLVPALLALWLVVVLLTIVARSGRGVGHVVWVIVPAVVLFAPLVWGQLRAGNLWGLLADPGIVWAGDAASADALGRGLLAAGIPGSDPGDWGRWFADLGIAAPVWWVPLLVAPVALLALTSTLTRRWLTGVAALLVAALGLATAFAAVAIAVSARAADPVSIWPGTALSLFWIGLVAGALVTLDEGLPEARALPRVLVGGAVVAALAVFAVPSLTAAARGAWQVSNGPDSTLPAFVAAQGAEDPDVGTIVLTPRDDGSVAASVVWGASAVLGAQSTIDATRITQTASDREVADLTADLVTTTSDDVVARLSGLGIGFVLLAPATDDEADPARALRLQAGTALSQQDGLDTVGETARGVLWRVSEPGERAGARRADSDLGRAIGMAQLAAVGAALLLAIPTSASRRQARRQPRVVGPVGRPAAARRGPATTDQGIDEATEVRQ